MRERRGRIGGRGGKREEREGRERGGSIPQRPIYYFVVEYTSSQPRGGRIYDLRHTIQTRASLSSPVYWQLNIY